MTVGMLAKQQAERIPVIAVGFHFTNQGASCCWCCSLRAPAFGRACDLQLLGFWVPRLSLFKDVEKLSAHSAAFTKAKQLKRKL